MALIPEPYMDAVVALGIKNNTTKRWVATGFLVGKQVAEGYKIYLITNKHVFAGTKDMVVRFNIPHQVEAKDFDISLVGENDIKLYSVHPDEQVDVACMYINGVTLEKQLGTVSCFVLGENTLSRSEMIENEITEGSLIYTLGFPAGLVGLQSKAPLCRMGCISRIKEPVNSSGFLLDTQNFPGSSGSPVINRLESNRLQGSKCFNKTCLIGIIAAYIPYKDVLVSKQTGETMQINQENSGLAIAYTVDAIREVISVEDARVAAIVNSNRIKSDDSGNKGKN